MIEMFGVWFSGQSIVSKSCIYYNAAINRGLLPYLFQLLVPQPAGTISDGEFLWIVSSVCTKYHSYTLVIVDGNLRTDDYSDKGSFK